MTRKSAVDTYKWKEHCLFCGKICKEDPTEVTFDRSDIHRVTLLQYKKVILQMCKVRKDDTRASEDKHRVTNCENLVQEEACYHECCCYQFSVKSILYSGTSSQARARPKRDVPRHNFEKLCEWLETEGELYTVAELDEKMREVIQSNEIYTMKSLKTMLKEKYEDMIFFTELHRKADVVCFRDAGRIFN